MLEIAKPIIRTIVGVMFAILYRVTHQARYEWMAHYLLGDGMPKRLVDDGGITPMQWLDMAYDGTGSRLWDSRNYNNCGFYGRPELFYLVGSFTAHIHVNDEEVVRELYYPASRGEITPADVLRQAGVMVWAEDVYDWHPMQMNDGDWGYYASPIPIIPSSWVWPLNDFFGHTFFDLSFGGEFAISNYFWDWLEGTPFTTEMSWDWEE